MKFTKEVYYAIHLFSKFFLSLDIMLGIIFIKLVLFNQAAILRLEITLLCIVLLALSNSLPLAKLIEQRN